MDLVKSPNGPSLSFRLYLSALLVLSLTGIVCAQSATEPSAAESSAPSQSEQFQSRITRARALVAAHQLNTAASELEQVRAATQDESIRSVTSIMLMSIYLEEGNYGRAEALLEESFQARSTKKDEAIRTYFALAGQAVNGARTHLARYRTFGINPSAPDLPAEAVNDLNRLRSLVERMIAQAKGISTERRGYDSLSLVEDVIGVRLSLAKDAEDQATWQSEYAKAREVLAASQTEVASLGGGPMLMKNFHSSAKRVSTPQVIPAASSSTQPTTEEPKSVAPQPAQSITTSTESAPAKPISSDSVETTAPGTQTDPAPSQLNAKATKKVIPRYPDFARKRGDKGLVRVFVIIDETGKVVEIAKSEGPMSLRAAAEEAARDWWFEAKPDLSRPARFMGYIDFNFTL